MKTNWKNKMRNDFRQYGFWGFVLKNAKSILRVFHIEINTYYYMVNDIDYEKQKALFEQARLVGVRELTNEDFAKGDKTVFTEKKMLSIKRRFETGNYRAFGIVEDDELIYSCWLSLQWLESHNKSIEGELLKQECLLVDAYCAPKGRGRGIHSAMNSYRLTKAYEAGKKRSIVIILAENKPAYKSQLKTGNKVLFKFFVMNIGKKSVTNYFKKKSKSV